MNTADGNPGVSYIFSTSKTDSPELPPVIITELLITNLPEENSSRNKPTSRKGAPAASTVSLNHNQNNLTFKFAASNSSGSTRHQYLYKLEGFSEEWISDNGSHTATFNNLPAGKYIFRVKSSDDSRHLGTREAALGIRISSPPWKSRWIYLIFAGIFLGILYVIRRYEMNRLHWKNRLQLKQLENNKLQEMDQLKSRFFANISHEFRTPLTLILGQLERVIGTSKSKEERRRLEVAHRNSRRLLNLINQILDLSKLEAGSMQLKSQPQNIIPFLKNLIYSFESWWERKKITISLQCPYQEVMVNFDPEKLEQVFYNLLANAIKFTPEGGSVDICIRMSQKKQLPPGQPSLEIGIQDSSPGIAGEDLHRIFDRFYQAGKQDSPNAEGSGIGLALVKELVELHQGLITVTSQSGEGCVFTVYLPAVSQPSQGSADSQNTERHSFDSGSELEEATSPEPQPPIVPVEKTDVDTFGSHPEKERPVLLLVEDHYDLRAYMQEQLQEDFKVLGAANGNDGLKIARQEIPDLIITDVMMPQVDGYQLCKKLQEDERTSHIPIIILTARAEMDDKIEGLELGVDDYLVKPFSPRELITWVNNLIELRRRLRRRFKEKVIVKPSEVTAVPIEQAFLKKVITAIEENLAEEGFDVTALAKIVGMSISQLNRKLHALVDQPAGQLLRSLRLQRAADLLTQNAATVAEITYQVGFTDQANFSRAFKKQFGKAPGEFRKQAEK
ncbi:MAG: hypothetical protein Kow0037_04830 [Calditrichia bacterium]